MDELKNVAAKILAEDKKVISYRPSWKQMTGSVTSAILLQQIRFHYLNKGGKPFYKFFAPPKTGHEKYREGDSWVEELGFTLDELRGAMKKIGKRLTREDMNNFDSALDGCFVGYFRDQNHVTWYYFNEDYFMDQVVKLYSPVEDEPAPSGQFPSGKIQSRPQVDNSQVGKSNLAKWEKSISIPTETPTEILTTTTANDQTPKSRQEQKQPPISEPSLPATWARPLPIEETGDSVTDPENCQTFGDVCRVWEDAGGMLLSRILADQLNDLCVTYTPRNVGQAILEAAINGVVGKINYIKAILVRWATEGKTAKRKDTRKNGQANVARGQKVRGRTPADTQNEGTRQALDAIRQRYFEQQANRLNPNPGGA